MRSARRHDRSQLLIQQVIFQSTVTLIHLNATFVRTRKHSDQVSVLFLLIWMLFTSLLKTGFWLIDRLRILLGSPLGKSGTQSWAAVSNLELKNQNENVIQLHKFQLRKWTVFFFYCCCCCLGVFRAKDK